MSQNNQVLTNLTVELGSPSPMRVSSERS